MIEIEYEIIAKYNGDILRLENELNISVEILNDNFAIIISTDPNLFDQLLDYTEIEYIERPFILETQDEQSFSTSGITSFKNRTGLSGRGTLIGLIDSGIDYTLPVFRDVLGNSKILFYWDQSIGNNPPEGFKEGTLYTNSDINEAINGNKDIPVSITAMHGTHVGSICAQIANNAEFIIVRVGNRQTDIYSRSTEFMRAIKFILEKALELGKPIAINMSYGTNEGSHTGLSLFEQYIDDMCLYWKNNMVVAAGNNGNKGGHKRVDIKNSNEQIVEFVVGQSETVLNINIWPNFVDQFTITLIDSSNNRTQELSANNNEISNNIRGTTILGRFYEIMPYSLQRRITIRLSSDNQITPGIWKIQFSPINIVDGIIDLYLPTSEGLNPDTRFLSPSNILTVTVPGTASRVITVGSYNSRTDVVSAFSGRGDTMKGIFKPDLLAPGENIVSYLVGGTTGALTGTSMATPHVTGCCALLMEWGIIQKNDLYLYSQKLKALLLQNARRSRNGTYPSDSNGYGFLDMSSIYFNRSDNDLSVKTKQQYKRLEYINNFIKKNRLNFKRQNDSYLNSIFVYFNNPEGFFNSLKISELESNFRRLSENSGIFSETDTEIILSGEFFNIEGVVSVESLSEMSLLSQVSSGTSGGFAINEDENINYIKNNPNLNLTGRNVIIAIADTGIDYLHPDFINADGTSKILYLWDQTKEGNSPEGFYFGTEYTRDDINRAISENDSTLSTDEVGSGTLLSGICAGLGVSNSLYEGIAKDSELIVIKLGTIEGKYNNAYYYVARDYARKKARELERPLIINTSVGTNSDVGFINRATQSTIWYQYGECEIAGIGNEGNTQTHASGKISAEGETQTVEIEIEEEEEFLKIELWICRPDRVNIKIISPTGEESKDVGLGYYKKESGIFNFENTTYAVFYVFPTSYSGQEFITINLYNASPGIWKINLTGVYINSGCYNVYLPNRSLINQNTRFLEPDPFYTVNFPTVDRNIFTVGAYDMINNSMWPPSSRGPNIRNIQKPNIVAPGVNIISAYPHNRYGNITGTSAAAAVTSGVAALFLQYVTQNNQYKRQGFTQSIYSFFQLGADREDNIQYPNFIYGYGLLNARKIFEEFR